MEAAVSLVVPFGYMLGAATIEKNRARRKARSSAQTASKQNGVQTGERAMTPGHVHSRATVNGGGGGGGCGCNKGGGDKSREQDASKQEISERFQRLTQQIGGLLGGGSRRVRR